MDNFLYLTEKECKDLIWHAEKLKNWFRREQNSTRYWRVVFEPTEVFSKKIKNYCRNIMGFDVNVVNVAVIKYEEGDGFPVHRDGITDSIHGKLIYNINVLLNNDFEGGDVMIDGNKIDNDVGKIYHYDSRTLHGVSKITKGIRYLALFYLRDQDIINYKIKKSII
jgi:predicted 2-oxoglutarate/Fe(II)-dependent dioxygenase YbiX